MDSNTDRSGWSGSGATKPRPIAYQTTPLAIGGTGCANPLYSRYRLATHFTE